MKLYCLWAALVLALPLAAAPIEYAHTGNHFNGFSIFAGVLPENPVAAFSFIDGAQTFNIASSPLAIDHFDIATDANGDFSDGDIGADGLDAGPFIATSNASSHPGPCDCDAGAQPRQSDEVDEDPGSWLTGTPEPGAIALTGLGLLVIALLLGGLRRRTT